MGIRTKLVLIIALFLSFTQLSAQTGSEKKAVLIIAHGSRSAEWNELVLSLENVVSERLSSENISGKTRVAFMEMAQPSIADVIRDLEKSGIEQVFAVPLFINLSGHSMFDVPAILGLSFEKNLVQAFMEEGIEIVKTDLNIVLGPTLNYGELIQQILLDRVKELSVSPDSEGIVLLTHGSPQFEPFWHNACQEVGAYLCAKTSISKFDYVFIEVGQYFKTEGLPRILDMAKNCERVIVSGLYLSLAPVNIANRYLKEEKLDHDWFTSKNIYFSGKGLLPDDRLVGWIVDRVIEWTTVNERTELK